MTRSAKRSYSLTTTGEKALKAHRSLPGWYRSILCFVECELAVGAILRLMPAERPSQVLAWIDELETLGFIEDLAPQPVKSPITPEDLELDLVAPIHRMAA